MFLLPILITVYRAIYLGLSSGGRRIQLTKLERPADKSPTKIAGQAVVKETARHDDLIVASPRAGIGTTTQPDSRRFLAAAEREGGVSKASSGAITPQACGKAGGPPAGGPPRATCLFSVLRSCARRSFLL